MTTNGNPVLSVQDLAVIFDTPQGPVHAVNGVSFDLFPGETLAIVGESGCGKTMSALAVLGLAPQPEGRIVSGEARYAGRDLLQMSTRQLRRIRGEDISMIFQEPVSSLNPVFTIGQQIIGVLQAHDSSLSRRAAKARCTDLLESVGSPTPLRDSMGTPTSGPGGCVSGP